MAGPTHYFVGSSELIAFSDAQSTGGKGAWVEARRQGEHQDRQGRQAGRLRGQTKQMPVTEGVDPQKQ